MIANNAKPASASALLTIQAGYPVFVRLGSVGYWFSTGGGNALEGATTLRPNVVAGVPLTNNDWHDDPYGNHQNKRLINQNAGEGSAAAFLASFAWRLNGQSRVIERQRQAV